MAIYTVEFTPSNGDSANYTHELPRVVPAAEVKGSKARFKTGPIARHSSESTSLLWILFQQEPEHLFFGLGRYEERNCSVPLVGEVMLFPLNVKR
jgi:hypothetical protein